MENHFTEIEKVMNSGLVLLDIKTDKNAQLVQIIIDSERPVTLDDTTGIMKKINNDDQLSTLFPDDYRLEISSPGMGAELKHPFQFRKNIGRNLILKVMENGKTVKRLGTLVSVTDKSIVLERNELMEDFLLENINSAKIKISFN